jgi:hypothetical protein
VELLPAALLDKNKAGSQSPLLIIRHGLEEEIQMDPEAEGEKC